MRARLLTIALYHVCLTSNVDSFRAVKALEPPTFLRFLYKRVPEPKQGDGIPSKMTKPTFIYFITQ